MTTITATKLNTLYTFCCEPFCRLVHRVKRESFRCEVLDIRHVQQELLPITKKPFHEFIMGRYPADLVTVEIAEFTPGQMFFGGNPEILDERRTDDAKDRFRHVLQRLVWRKNFVIPFVTMDVLVQEGRFPWQSIIV